VHELIPITAFVDSQYYVTVTCINKAGVPSRASHAKGVALRVGSKNMLQYHRLSCQAELCDGSCSCGYKHRCDKPSGTCGVTSSPLGGITLSAPSSSISFDALAVLLQGAGSRTVQYSLSLVGQPPGAGVFQAGEDIWYDYGPGIHVTLTTTRVLLQGTTYTAHARVWLTDNTYQLVKSGPILLTRTAPVLPIIALRASSTTRSVTATWVSAGIDDHIISLAVGLGTYPGAVDLIDFTSVSRTSSSKVLTIPASSAERAIVYATLRGTTATSVEVVKTSNAARFDLTPPTTGRINIVHHGVVWNHVPYTASSSNLSLAWAGFSDPVSGIQDYQVCVEAINASASCNVMAWTSVGRAAGATIAVPMAHSQQYRVAVRAMNEVGLASAAAVRRFTCDTTGPVLDIPLKVVASFTKDPDDGVKSGLLTLTASWAASDHESWLADATLTLGTVELGQQLLASIPVVSSPVVWTVAVNDCPAQAHATLIVRNVLGQATIAKAVVNECV
jgi:hypothetical protein